VENNELSLGQYTVLISSIMAKVPYYMTLSFQN
jgi:hypothetical protein